MKAKSVKYTLSQHATSELKDALPGAARPPARINVRAAKDQLSGLLDRAAAGEEILITSDGIPKARLAPVVERRKRLSVDWALLRSMPLVPDAPRAEELIRQDREGRP